MKFHHIGYLVKNINESVYAFEKLGYKIERKIKYDEIRIADICFLQKNINRIELVSPRGKDSPIYGLMKHYKNSPYHLCFVSDNLDCDIKNLEKEGFFLFKDPERAPCLDDNNVVFLMNHSIGIIELVENGTYLLSDDRQAFTEDNISITGGT